MAKFSFSTITNELKQMNVEDQGLSFEDKQLTWDTAEDVKDIVEALNNTKVVHYLKLGGNTLGIDAAAAIGKALERHPEFHKALWYNMFSRRLKTETPISLKHLGNGLMVAKAQLTILDLSDNALGPNAMVGLEDVLRSPVCYTLQELRLNNCGLGIGGGRMLSKAMLDCHRNSTAAGTPLKLKVFITGRNRLENDGAKAIAAIFSTLKTLEEIVMPQNSIYHEGVAALAEGFKQNPNLRVLNLNDNTVTERGAMALAEVFACTPHLREINFGDCLLKDNGACHFAEALGEGHRELEVVDLGYNEIGPDAGLAIVDSLQNKPNLQLLNLDGNQFGYDGRELIKEAMEATANPGALESLDEDQSADEEDDEEDDEDEEDTTEEADEDEEYQDEDAEDDEEGEAYTTSQAYSTNILNDSFVSSRSVLFPADSTTTNIQTADSTAAGSYNAESFCLSQTPFTLQQFEALPESNKLEAFKAIINQFSEDNHLLVLIFTAMKCAHLAQSSTAALDLAMSLFTEAIDYAVDTKQERRVLNYILIQLGLLRSEEKFNSPYNLKSCRYALSETLNKHKIASDNMKNTFSVFLGKLNT